MEVCQHLAHPDTFLYGHSQGLVEDVKGRAFFHVWPLRGDAQRKVGMSEKTKKLTKAKEVKNDEFYTQYADIQKEVNAYLDYDENVFRGKTVLLPCDDPEWSNFTKFFAQNFERFGLK